MGTGAVLALFGLVIYAGIRIALRSQDLFVRLCAGGLTAWIAIQALINIGAVLGLLPIAGVPLPLVSYGGSALLPMLLALGLLLALRPQRARGRGGPRRAQGRPARTVRRALPADRMSAEPGTPNRRSRRRRAEQALARGARRRRHGRAHRARAEPRGRAAPARPSTSIVALGTERGLETRLVPERGYQLALIPAVPLPRRPSRAMLSVGPRLRAAVTAVSAVLDRGPADVVVGFGGYVSTPAYLAARRRRVPYVVHEQNARPGLANRLGARGTRFVATSTPASSLPARAVPRGCRCGERSRPSTGRPCAPRPGSTSVSIRTGRRCWSPAARRARAGSTRRCPALQPSSLRQVLRCCTSRGRRASPRCTEPVAAGPGTPPYIVLGYCDRMDLAYAAADLVLCRAGAGTVAEVCAVGLPAVFVPLPIGNGEQRLNAEPVVAAGGGLLVADEDCTPSWVRSTVLPLLVDRRAAGPHGASRCRARAPGCGRAAGGPRARSSSEPSERCSMTPASVPAGR